MTPSASMDDHFLCRLSLLPLTVAEDLRSDVGRALLDRIMYVTVLMEADRDRVSELLYREIGETTDLSVRRDLISLRRHLFSFRHPKEGSGAAVLLEALNDRCADLRRYAMSIAERDRLTDEFAEAFEASRERARHRLSEWTKRPAFQRGLMLGSASLFDAQAAFHRSLTKGKLSGKLARTERGLLRYLLRASMKATPFGSFCIVAPGRLAPEPPPAARDSSVEGDLHGIGLSIRLNKLIYATLTGRLAQRPAVRDGLTVETNPTIRQVGDSCVFLALSEGREAFQRVPASPVFLLLLSVIADRPGMRFGEFVESIATHPDIECTHEQAAAYAGRMLDTGAIRLCFGIPEQEADWAAPLADLLAGIADPLAQETASSLRELVACVQASETASLAEHVRLAAEMKRIVAAVFHAFEMRADEQWPFLEDATADVRQVIHKSRAIDSLESTMGRLVAAGLRLSWPRTRQAELRHFFSRHFAGASSVSLLDFYETFYREHFKQYLALSDQVANEGLKAADGYDFENPFKLPIIDQIRSARARLTQLVTRCVAEAPDAVEVKVPLEEVEAIVSAVPWTPTRPASVVVIGTLVEGARTGDHPRFICRRWQTGVGHGRMFSRWLHMLEPGFLDQLRLANAGFAGPDRLAEIAIDGGHNANLHPAMLPWDISYPNTEGTQRPNVIRPTDLVVEPDPSDAHALRLRHVPSNASVVPIDLGFQATSARPPLFQLLTAFSPPSGLEFPIPEVPLARLPRIVVGAIVASRRRWMLPHSSIPKPLGGEPDWQYALRLERWRHDHGLPLAGYMRYANPAVGEGRPEESTEVDAEQQRPRKQKRFRAHLNELKPQYIDFSSPLTANLLQHEATSDRPRQIVFEEQYPTADLVPTIEGRPHAIEHVVQVTCTP